jgi:hypothetical protein
MNIYHAWCDLKPGVSDIAFSEGASKYLTHLQAKGMIESWRITRRKLGLAPPELGEFHLMIEVKDLAQLDRAFDHVAERSEPTEGYHFGVNSLVQNVRFALYRDFPDPQRQRGAERF